METQNFSFSFAGASPQPHLLRPKFLPNLMRVIDTCNNKSKKIKATTTSSAPLPPPPLLRVSSDSLQYPPGFLGAVPERDGSGNAAAVEYCRTNIVASNFYQVAVESPLQFAPKISQRLGVNMWLKREDLQPGHSFKLRGAYNMMSKLPREHLERGVICTSAGNHSHGVVLSAQRLGCNVMIVTPVTTSELEWKRLERLGATIVLVGDSQDEAQAYAIKRGEEEGRTFIPPFDHPDVIMGHGTVGMEIVDQMQGSLHAIFVPIGGGGLIAGIAAYVKMASPECLILEDGYSEYGKEFLRNYGFARKMQVRRLVLERGFVLRVEVRDSGKVKVIGVEPIDANAMALSLHHGKRVLLDQVGDFVKGVDVKVVGEEDFRLCRELIDGVVLVSEKAICASMKDMYEQQRTIVEPAGALALAGAEAYCKYYGLKDETVVAVTSGANMDSSTFRRVSLVANADGQGEAMLAIFLPEKPGSFGRFCGLFCDQIVGINIREFTYKNKFVEGESMVLCSVGPHTVVSEVGELVDGLRDFRLRTFSFTVSNFHKDHLHGELMMRQRNELLCRFVLPERDDLIIFLIAFMISRWDISFCHYHRQGETTGATLLIGIQVAGTKKDEFWDHVKKLGYEYTV
ncbi:hypothetical protein RHMOL_Rhmol10G0051000 [Rhododendron molle]|uniref:Uncharacterized protein n=2 Tax=Rhododendron molle TaxID=49168 RepID=A0ACC0LZ75_RHOML|nr:hypothetical protein RHMOL_Rhmol10G0051000 [Rhododendron molle]KAI8533956.1 hypothetical protein RHMOL_Rhmol10G0051000 [Rhododendron molle]